MLIFFVFGFLAFLFLVGWEEGTLGMSCENFRMLLTGT